MLSLATSPLSFSAPLAAMPSRSVVRMQEGMPTPEPTPAPRFSVKDLPGISGPFGFFDPAGFCDDASEGKIKFYRGEPCFLRELPLFAHPPALHNTMRARTLVAH